MIGECRNGMMWTGTHWIPVETGSLATALFLKGFVIIFIANAVGATVIVYNATVVGNVLLALIGAGVALAGLIWGLTQFAAGSQMVSRIMQGTNVLRFTQG